MDLIKENNPSISFFNTNCSNSYYTFWIFIYFWNFLKPNNNNNILNNVGCWNRLCCTFHFRMEELQEKGFTSKEATDKAYKYTSRPIIANAFGLAIGLSAMLLSPLQIHVYVSTLMWVSMITAVFLSLSVLPTILRKLK